MGLSDKKKYSLVAALPDHVEQPIATHMDMGDAVLTADRILEAVAGFSVIRELDALQDECRGTANSLPRRYGMPLRIYNYILGKYRLRIDEEEE